MDALSSSPDPLNASATLYSPRKNQRPVPMTKRSLPLQRRGSSPKKQTFDLDIGDEKSPQKIRVTVEAGRSDTENAYTYHNPGASVSPTRERTNRRRERTTTTTIPLKGLSDSDDEAPKATTPKRGRGRPRKSDTPVAAKKASRASTPARKNRKSVGDVVDGDDSDNINIQIGTGLDSTRGKGDSRSRSAKGARQSKLAAKEAGDSSEPSLNAVRKKGRGRPKSTPRDEVEVLVDESCQGSGCDYGVEDADSEGRFGPIDSNDQDPPSAYSPKHSTRTTREGDGDVSSARFGSENETPRQKGWSSPRTTSSQPRTDNLPPPSSSTAKPIYRQSEDESMATTSAAASETRDLFATNRTTPEHQDEEEEADELGEMRESDTILESEGFSMISVDSVPSLREHLSSPANQPEKQASSRAKTKPFVSPRATGYDDSFSVIPTDVLEAATPRPKPQNLRMLSVQNSRADDSFSSLPQDVLDAATPHQNAQKDRPSITNLEVNGQYEDVASAVPPAILDAATPGSVRQGHLSDLPENPGSRATSASHAPGSVLSRLITPEETPSPSEEPSRQSQNSGERPPSLRSSKQIETSNKSQDSSTLHSQLPSSPPCVAPRRCTYTAHLRQQRQLNTTLTQTPSIIFSSPALPPLNQVGRGAPLLAPPSEKSEPRALSPTVRAGQMLQEIIIPSSSSRSRSQSLGSPFKSPTTDRKPSSSAAEGSYPSPGNARLNGPLPKLDLNDHFSGASQTRLPHQEDPFRSSALTQQRSLSSEEKSRYSLELPGGQKDCKSLNHDIESEASFQDDDAMSWQAEEQIPDPASIRSNKDDTNQSQNTPIQDKMSTADAEERWAAERAAVVEQFPNAGSNKIMVIDSDDEDAPANEDEEAFGLLLETINSSSPVAERQNDPPQDVVEKPRRSKLPSPWRQNSRRLVYSDELSNTQSSPLEAEPVATKKLAKEMVSQPITVRRAVQQGLSDGVDADLSGYQIPQKSNFNPRPRESGNLNLSALLAASPPKHLPTLSRPSQQSVFPQLSKSNQSSSCTAPAGQVAEPNRHDARDSSRFAPIQQMMDSKPRAPADSTSPALSRVLATEPAKRGRLSAEFAPIPQKAGFKPRTSLEPSSSLFASREHAVESAAAPASQTTSSKETGFTPIPQKQGFKPRTQAVTPSLPIKPAHQVPNLFSRAQASQTIKPPDSQSSNPVSEPLAAASPSRTNARSGYARSAASAQLSSSVSGPDTAAEDQENVAGARLRTQEWAESLPLRVETTVNVALHTPLPPAPASPTKSCLRSPLKTPHGKPSSGHGSGSASRGVTFASSSPVPASPTVQLSAHTWSKDHWRLLDSIIQTWRPENNRSSSSGARRRRNSTRVISRLLGKTARYGADNTTIRFEQWHLEAVDEFRGHVPGWDEQIIAMRLVSILIGERQRAAGLVRAGD